MQKTKINWSGYTWNPWTGCSKVSEGCKFCYMDIFEEKKGQDPKVVKKNTYSAFYGPIIGKRRHESLLIFTCSMSDFFHPDADKWRDEAWDIIRKTPNHNYQILTKRPERIKECLPKDWCKEKFGHVWLGTSVENSDPKVLNRIQILKEIKCSYRFISFEPLLEEIKIDSKDLEGIHWAIIGGESGVYKNGTIPQFREAKPEWFRSLRDICKEAGVLVWFKQAGTHLARKYGMSRKGEDLNQIPADLRLRERPEFINMSS